MAEAPRADRLTVVMGGGGVKAAAHAGAWRALRECGLQPRALAGTSMGAVIAACFASGVSLDAVAAAMRGVTRKDVARLRPLVPLRGLSLPSLFRAEPLRATIERMVPARRFSDLVLPLTVTAVDIASGELVLFGPGGEDAPLVDALLASCALPVFYPPVVIGGRHLVDGGLRAVLPLEATLRFQPDLVVAIDTGPGFDETGERSPMPALLAAHNDSTGILMAENTRLQLEHWRQAPARPPLVYVRPRVERHVTFRVELAAQYMEEGYRATRAALGVT